MLRCCLVLTALLVAGCAMPPSSPGGLGSAFGVPRDGRPVTNRSALGIVRPEGEFVKCVGIVDAATIQVDWHGDVVDVILIGVKAPTGQRGEAAKGELASLVAGETVELVFPFSEPDWEGPGLMTAYVEVGGRDVGEHLLRKGTLARVDDPAHPRLTRYRGLNTSKEAWEGDTYWRQEKPVSPLAELFSLDMNLDQ